MTILDDIKKMKSIDKSDVYGSIEQLPQQCIHAYGDCETVMVPESYIDINKIVLTGMGGSGLGARIMESVYALEIKHPLIRINDYDLPSWADEKTLVICSSFSGATAETIENAKQAIKRGCKWLAIGSGGTLIDLAQENKAPFYKIIPTYNPSKEPRMAVGYSVVGQLSLSSKAKIINFTKEDLERICSLLEEIVKKCNVEVPFKNNQAKKLAKKLFNKIVIFVGARHMLGALHTVKNQLNENSKTFSTRFDLPELNHHLMEGLVQPSSNKENLFFLFIDSDLYPEIIRKRLKITEDVVEKLGIGSYTFKVAANAKLSQAFEFIQFGGFVNFYLGMLYQTDPAPIPWVDYFKNRLGQPLGQWKKSK